MNILVTGATGFIGSCLVETLSNAGHNVIGIDNYKYSYPPRIFPKMKFYEGDICNKSTLSNIFLSNKIDLVCHLAAESTIGKCMNDPEPFFEVNVSGGLKILENMKLFGVNKIVVASTASTYGEPKTVWIDENHPQNPINSYGLSKLMFEQMLKWYASAYGFKYIMFRFFNVCGCTDNYGENRKNETHLIPLVLKKIFNDEPVEIYGNDYPTEDGTAIRDYVHVKDICQAFLLGIEKLDIKNEIYNLGSESGFSVNDIVFGLHQLSNKHINIKYVARRPGDPIKLIADSSWAKTDLGWNPRYSDIFTVLEDSVNWYKKLNNII